MEKPKFCVNESVIWKGATRSAEATIEAITADGYIIYEWDKKIVHPATEESLTKID